MRYETQINKNSSDTIHKITFSDADSAWYDTNTFKSKDNRYVIFTLHRKWWAKGYSIPGNTSPAYATTNIYGNTAYTTITGGQTTGGVMVPAQWRYKQMRTEIDCKDWTYNLEGDNKAWETLFNARPGNFAWTVNNIATEFCYKLTQNGGGW